MTVQDLPYAHGDGKASATFRIKVPQSGEYLRLIGMADLKSEAETIIQITNADTIGFVILDAIQLVRVEPDAVKHFRNGTRQSSRIGRPGRRAATQ